MYVGRVKAFIESGERPRHTGFLYMLGYVYTVKLVLSSGGVEGRRCGRVWRRADGKYVHMYISGGHAQPKPKHT